MQYLEEISDIFDIPQLGTPQQGFSQQNTVYSKKPINMRKHPEMEPIMQIMGGKQGVDPSYNARSQKDPDALVMGTPEYMPPEQARGTVEYLEDPIEQVARLYTKIFPGLNQVPQQILQAWMDFRNAFYGHIQEGFRDWFRRNSGERNIPTVQQNFPIVQQDPRGPGQEIPSRHDTPAGRMLWNKWGDINKVMADRDEKKRQPHQAEYMIAWTGIQKVNPRLEELNKAFENVTLPQMQELKQKFDRFYSIWSTYSNTLLDQIQQRASQAGHDLPSSVNNIRGLVKNDRGEHELDPALLSTIAPTQKEV